MNTKLLLLTGLLWGTFNFSQEVKVKKGEIQLDGKSIAKIDKDKGVYTVSDLTGKPLFTATITNQTPLKNTADSSWLVLTGTNGKVREVALMRGGTFSLGFEKPITENLVLGNSQLLASSGVDQAKIDNFFQTEDRSISTQADIIIEKEKKIAKSEDSIAAKNKLTIGNAGIISANGNKIGYIVRKTELNDPLGFSQYSYSVLDINKLPIGKVNFQNAVHTPKELKTYDGKSFQVKESYSSEKPETDDLANRIVKKLYANGYTLGDMKSMVEIANQENQDAANALAKSAEDKAKAGSKNIYDADGYVIDKNGTKKAGKITIEFESIDGKLGREKGMGDLTNYGGSVNLTANGKTENYKAKDGIIFCAGDRCFLGTSGSEDGGTGNSSGSQLSVLGESQFFEIQSEKNGNYVLNHVKNPEYYYLKLSNQSKAIYLGDKASFEATKKPEKIKKLFDSYVACSTIDFSKYDTKTKEGLIQVLNDYANACKK